MYSIRAELNKIGFERLKFDTPDLKVFCVTIFFFPISSNLEFLLCFFGRWMEEKMINMSACIVIYFHTLVWILLRIMAGVGITVSRSMTDKFQLKITFPYVFSSVLSMCIGHIFFLLFFVLPCISTLISRASTTFGSTYAEMQHGCVWKLI